MTRTWHLPIAGLLLLALTGSAAAQTADEVIEKTIAAAGGRAAFAKLKSRVSSGTIVLRTPVGDVEGTVEVTNVSPNKARTVIKADLSSLGAGPFTLDQRFNGTAGYILDNLQGNRDMAGSQLDNMRNQAFPNAALNYKDLGVSAKLLGKEKVGDREAFVVAFEPPSGSTIRQFIDTETYLPIKAVVKVEVPQLGQEIEQVTTMTDYRAVDGVKIPFKLEATSSVQSYTITLTKVEHNVVVDDAIFSKPAAK